MCCKGEFGISGDGDGELIVDVRSEVRRLLFGYRLLEELSRVSESGSACFRYALVGRPIGLVFGSMLGGGVSWCFDDEMGLGTGLPDHAKSLGGHTHPRRYDMMRGGMISWYQRIWVGLRAPCSNPLFLQENALIHGLIGQMHVLITTCRLEAKSIIFCKAKPDIISHKYNNPPSRAWTPVRSSCSCAEWRPPPPSRPF